MNNFKNINFFMFLCGLLKGGNYMWYSADRVLTLNALFNFIMGRDAEICFIGRKSGLSQSPKIFNANGAKKAKNANFLFFA